MNRVLYIVDGYNVLHAVFPRMKADELEQRRSWLVESMTGLVAVRGASAVVVFDVKERVAGSCERVAGTTVEVCFAGGPYAADAFIARRIAEQPPDVTVLVVSADQEVQRTAARAGVHRLTPLELAADLDRLSREVEERLANGSDSVRMRSQLEDKVDVETLRKLERLRREGAAPDGTT